MSLIERKSIDEAYERIKLARGYKRNEIVPRGEVLDMLLKAIDYAPTVDAVPVKHGHWEDIHIYQTINKFNKGLEFQHLSVEAMCSNCHTYSDHVKERFDSIIKFCPVCGAWMDEVKE